MKTAAFFAALAALPLIMFAEESNKFFIVKDGASCLAIAAEENTGNSGKFAAEEFQRIIREITDAEVESAAENTTPRLIIKVDPALESEVDTFSLSISESGDMIAAGNNPRSAMFAVFELLERLGCRWFWPGALGEYLPKHTGNLAISTADFPIKSSAAFIQRQLSTHPNVAKSAFFAHNKMNPFGDPHNYGFTRSWGGHSFNWIFPADCKTIEEYFKKYPEQFALVNGVRMINQHCYTSAETFATFSSWIDKFWQEHPDVEVLVLSPRDAPIYCHCEECSKFDSSTLFFQFAKRLIEEADKKWPTKHYSTIAYSFYLAVPKCELPPSEKMTMSYCMYNRCYKHTFTDASCPVNPRAIKAMEDWKTTGATPAIYGYHFDAFGGVSILTDFSPVIADELRWSRDFGVRYWQTEFHANINPKKPLNESMAFVNRFPAYVIARLLWNPDTDERALLHDYCERVFGPAAAEMESYHLLMQEAWQAAGHVSYYNANPAGHVDNIITRELIEKIDELFASAAEKVSSDKRAAKILAADHEAWKTWRALKLDRDDWSSIAAGEDEEHQDFVKSAPAGDTLYSLNPKHLTETCAVTNDVIYYVPRKNAKGNLAHDGLLFGNHPRCFGSPCKWINYEFSFDYQLAADSKYGLWASVRCGGERFGEDFSEISAQISARGVSASLAKRGEPPTALARAKFAESKTGEWHTATIRVADCMLRVKIDGEELIEAPIPLGRGAIAIRAYESLMLRNLVVREIPSPSIAERWHVKVPYSAAAPKLDGSGNDPIWKNGYTTKTFKNRGSVRPKTVVTLLRTDDALFMKYECFVTDFSKVTTKKTERDDNQWADDCVEILLDPNNTRTDYFYLVVNSIGAQFDALASVGMNINKAWDGEWSTAASRVPDAENSASGRWIVEVKLPFSTFGEPKVGTNWLLGINRSGEGIRSSWTDASYHNPAAFRTMQMTDEE